MNGVWRRVWEARKSRRIQWGVAAVAVTGAVMALLVNWDVRRAGASIAPNPGSLPAAPVAVVFGAGYDSHGARDVLYDRVLTAVELYRAGRVKKLLMTGDNSRASYNEPEVMRRTAIGLGVPNRDIVLDYAGFRTYDSLYRAREIFGVREAILVSQAYHLPRALFIARGLGLRATGASADHRPYGGQLKMSVREALACESAWLDVYLLHPRPTYLGKREPIFP